MARAAGTIEILSIAGLSHETSHYTMERHVIVKAFASEQLDLLSVFRREIGPQLNDDTALGGVDDDRILLVEIGRKRLRDRGGRADQRDDEGENSDHENSGSGERAEHFRVAYSCRKPAPTFAEYTRASSSRRIWS